MIRTIFDTITTALAWLFDAGSARVKNIYGYDDFERG